MEDLDNARLPERVEKLEAKAEEMLARLIELEKWKTAATTKRCPVCAQTFTVYDGLFPTHMRYNILGDTVCPMSCGEAR